jgi:hypothetical protein
MVRLHRSIVYDTCTGGNVRLCKTPGYPVVVVVVGGGGTVQGVRLDRLVRCPGGHQLLPVLVRRAKVSRWFSVPVSVDLCMHEGVADKGIGGGWGRLAAGLESWPWAVTMCGHSVVHRACQRHVGPSALCTTG